MASYPREEVDLADYIAHGNNITYSVNKLFRRSIWQENRYEKMLFEDIALIPALVTRCRRVGYVPRPFTTTTAGAAPSPPPRPGTWWTL